MVKKLLKHEFLAYGRIMSIVYLVLLTIATASRIIQFFENDSITYSIVFNASCVTYGFSAFVTIVFGFVLGIIRFYKNLFTAEGYLTLTLPVSPAQHIWTKSFATVVVQLFTILVVLLSGCIITAGEMLSEIWKAMTYLLDELFALVGTQSILIGCEVLVLSVLFLFSSIMLYYTFIAIGQLFKKNRILAAVGAFFAFYILSQVVSVVLTIVLSILSVSGAFEEFLSWLPDFAQRQPYTLIHCTIWITALFPAIGILVEFLIIYKIITYKLNLE